MIRESENRGNQLRISNSIFIKQISISNLKQEIWNKECWETRWSAKWTMLQGRLQNETSAPQEEVDNHLGTRFRVFGRVLKWKSRRPTLHFQLYLHQKNLNFKSETRNDESVEVRRMLQGRLQNETRHKRKSTTIWEPDFFEVNIEVTNFISSSIFTKRISISNLKQGMLRALKCKECCKEDFITKRATRGCRPIWEPDFEFSVVFWSENRGDQLCFPALSSPKESQFQIWNKECWERWSAKNVARKTSERNAPQEEVDHHLGTRFRVFGRVLKWISRRPTLHFQLYLHQKNLNVQIWNKWKNRERDQRGSLHFQALALSSPKESQFQIWNKNEGRLSHKRKSTTIWEPDFEFSVVFWSENRSDQLCISSSKDQKNLNFRIWNAPGDAKHAWR